MTFKIYENSGVSEDFRYTYENPAEDAAESKLLIVRIPENPYFKLSLGWKFMGVSNTLVEVANGGYYSMNKILQSDVEDGTPIFRAYDRWGRLHIQKLEVLTPPFRYYCAERPLMPGGFPKKAKVTNIVNFDDRTHYEKIDMDIWGYIEYSEPLTDKEEDDYELFFC